MRSVCMAVLTVLVLALPALGRQPDATGLWVANFMGNHVTLREITACAKFAFHVVVEGEVDIDRGIGWAVERPHH